MRALPCILLIALSAAKAPLVYAEDMQLRARASHLLEIARAAHVLRGGPFIIRTEANFTATADDGSLQSGSYTRIRVPSGDLRQEIRFGDWQATSLFIDRNISTVGPWTFPPFAVRRLLGLVPFTVSRFDGQDVVRAIRDGSSHGQQATCVDYDTVHGEHRSSNELCVSKADGNLLSVREEDRAYEWSKYAQVAGSAYPQYIDFHEGTSFSLSVDLTVTKLDSVPENTFAIPSGTHTGTLCKTFSPPVPLRAPQPEARGGPNAPVIDVGIRLYVGNDGTVSQPHLTRPVRPDLDAEALKLVQTWVFEPATCNGHPNAVSSDVVLHFQGH